MREKHSFELLAMVAQETLKNIQLNAIVIYMATPQRKKVSLY